ncbi:MAG: hemolysin activation/secretion protein [Crocinitomicaceae bacterium]
MVAKKYKHRTSTVILFSIFYLYCINISNAENSDKYFKSEDSTLFKNKNTQSNNRDGTNPIITVTSFDTSRLKDLEEYEVRKSDLEEIIKIDQKTNNNRYTVDRLENLAETLSFYYKKQGLILTKVFFPPQDLKKKSLYLDIVMGEIEFVSSTKNESYSQDRLTRPFRDILNKPAYIPSLESSLIELNQYPGIELDTHFKEGSSIGKTQINIQVKDENLSDLNFSFDNYGSEYTGSMRGMLKASFYNLADQADQLNLNVLATFNPTNSIYFGSSYRFKIAPYYENPMLNSLFRYGLNATVGYQQTEYVAGGDIEAINYKGKANSLYIRLDKDFVLRNSYRFNSGIMLTRKRTETSQNGLSNPDDKLSIFTWSNQVTWNDTFMSPSATFIKFDFHQGLPGFAGAWENDDPSINRRGRKDGGIIAAAMDYKRFNLSITRNQGIGPYRFITKINNQHTSDLLLSSELSNLGGSGAVRGYSNSDFSGDKTTIFTMELVGKSNARKLSLPISDLKLAGFVDYGLGERLYPLSDEDKRAEMVSVGGYAQFIKEGKFSSKVEFAIPLKEVGDSKKNGLEVLFNFERGF